MSVVQTNHIFSTAYYMPLGTKRKNARLPWAFDWMYRKQLGRRNLTEELQEYCRGKMYEARKKTQGANNQYVQAKSEKDHFGLFHSGDTAQDIANELGIGQTTVKRSEKFAKGVDAIREISPDAAEKNILCSSRFSFSIMFVVR